MAVILRKVNELALNPGMNVQDGMLTTHSERMYLKPEVRTPPRVPRLKGRRSSTAPPMPKKNSSAPPAVASP